MTEPLWKQKYGDSAIYRLNRFIQDKLEGMQFINMADYVSDFAGQPDFKLPFMIPGQDAPELATIYDEETFKDLPYCIYSVSHRPSPDEPYMHCGQAAYNFHFGDIDTLMALADYLDELLKRDDWTAEDINNHFRADENYAFNFKWVSVLTTAGPGIATDEGGRSSFMVVIRYDAVYEGIGRAYTQEPGFRSEVGMR